MIVYGLSAEVGIGQLFIGGIVPGVLLAFCYAAYVLIRVNLNPKLAPTAAEAVQNGLVPVRKLGRQKLISVAMAVILIFCVMGSIYGGIASVTESAAVGVVGALLIAFLRGRLFRTSLLADTLVSTMSMVGTIMWLILGAISFVGIFNLVGGGDYLREMFLDLGLPALGIVIAMMAVLLVLGTFMEWIAIVLITVPVFAPVVVALWHPVCSQYPDLLFITTIRASLFLVKVSGTKKNHPSTDFCVGLAIHRHSVCGFVPLHCIS
jgi:TRAP-type mannitol/chloroaromatic compound transport system permease large subunit